MDEKLRTAFRPPNVVVMTPQLQLAIKLLATPTTALPALVDEWRASHPGCTEELPIGAPDPAEERDNAEAAEVDQPPCYLLDESPLPAAAADVWVFDGQVRANGRAFPRLVALGDSTEARWFVKALRRRAQTYEKVVRAVVTLRPEAASTHDGKLAKKIALRELAAAVEMHESTISRVVLACIFQTPHGVFGFTGKQQLGIARR